MAVVDSGINPRHPHVAPVAGGVRIYADADGYVYTSGDYRDRIGHGTAVAGLIRDAAPEAEIYAVRVLDERLRTYPTLLSAALEWAVEAGMDLVNVSISTQNTAARPLLEATCAECVQRGILVVAAAHNSPGGSGWPCACAGVIGVQAGAGTPEELLWHPQGKVTFSAYGHPRALPGVPPDRNFQGNSFAAGRVSGRIAALLTAHPDATPPDVLQLLIAQASNSN